LILAIGNSIEGEVCILQNSLQLANREMILLLAGLQKQSVFPGNPKGK